MNSEKLKVRTKAFTLRMAGLVKPMEKIELLKQEVDELTLLFLPSPKTARDNA